MEDMDWTSFKKYAITRLHYSDKTLDDRLRKLRHIVKHGFNIEDEESCYDFFAYKIDSGTPNTGLNHYVRALNAFHKYLDTGVVFDHFKESYKPVKIPTKDEVKAVLKIFGRSRMDKTMKTMTFLCANTGLRVSELCSIKLDHIDWKRCSILVLGKGKKYRNVPVKKYVLFGRKHPSLKNFIDFHRKNGNDYLFSWNGGYVTPPMFRKYFKTACRKSGSPWMHPHSLRHYYATMLLKKGVNVKIVQIILGHSDIKTTSRYLHMLDNDIFKAVDETPFDDLVFNLTIPTEEDFYGLVEIHNFFSELTCQGGMP